jgi:hypothetical protein
MDKDKNGVTIASIFLTSSFEPSDRLAVVLLNKRENIVIQRLASARAIAAPDFQEWLEDRNRHRFDVYVSMNALHPRAEGRTKNDIYAVRHIYLDFDYGGINAVDSMLRQPGMPKINNLFQTSPDRWQVIWKADGFTKSQAEELQKSLARTYGADLAATDCTRVLRLPGFVNHKYAERHVISAESFARDRYDPEQFPISLPKEREAQETPSQRRTGASASGPSQSEKDWAYAKRALARGESPRDVILAITYYRQDEKPNPHYYAKLTVEKAIAALSVERRGDGNIDR